jgi:hypothetical protein
MFSYKKMNYLNKSKRKGKKRKRKSRKMKRKIRTKKKKISNQKGGDAITIYIRIHNSGKLISIEKDGGDSIEDLKSEIHSKEGIPIDKQILISAGKKLEDTEIISELCKGDDELYITCRVEPVIEPFPVEPFSLESLDYIEGNPYRCCTSEPNSVKIIRAHGAVYAGSFVLPEGVTLILLNLIGYEWREKDYEAMSFCEHIKNNIYLKGLYLFKDNDKSKSISPTGHSAMELIGSHGIQISPKIKFAGENVNNQYLTFSQIGKTREGGISCINADKTEYEADCKNHTSHLKVGFIKEDDMKRGTLKDMIYINGKGTYIICACRVFSSSMTPEETEMSRTISS